MLSMIISHKYKFIFIKTGKTAGTSLEMALSRFMAPEDVLTTLRWPDEKKRFHSGFPTAQNFQKSLASLKVSEIPRGIRSLILSPLTQGERRLREWRKFPKRYWDHMPASAIRENVGPEIWESYYKFSVERNPWDMVISHYFWDPKKIKQNLSFRDFIFSGQALKSNFERYTLNGILAVDRLIRYDRIYHELGEVSRMLGLPENVGEILKGFSAKSGYRKNRDVESFYDSETRKIVEIFFAREIRLLNFQFGE